MIHLVKGQTNEVIVTLTEKTTVQNPVYLVTFVREEGGESKVCLCVDYATVNQRQRFNRLLITETETPNPLNSEVALETTGDWTYTIYAQTSTTNTDPAMAAEEVETGFAHVTGEAETTYTHSYNQGAIIYNPEND